jgi:hypothetical protein
MNSGFQGIQQDKLASVNAMHSQTSLRLISARDRIEGKSARAAMLHPAFRSKLSTLDTLMGGLPMRNPDANSMLTAEEEADLCAQLDASVQKILAIIALMINDTEADIAGMNDLMAIINAMSRDFFDFSDDPASAAKTPLERAQDFVFYYLENHL